MLFCGLDIGTTNVKGVVLSDHGTLLAKVSVSGQTSGNRGDWYRLFVEAMDRLVSQIGPISDEMYCSVASQGGSFVVLDNQLNAISEPFVWLDQAEDSVVEELLASYGPQEYYRLTGWPPAGWLPLCKLRGMQIAATDRVALVPDYICSRLTGTLVTDITNAQMTGMLDLCTGRWHADLLSWAGVEESSLPHVADKMQVQSEGIKMPWGSFDWVTSSHDQYAAMRAVGLRPDGDVMLATGTAWVINSKTREPAFDQLYLNHPGRDFEPGVCGNIKALGPIGRGFDLRLAKLDIDHEDLASTATQAGLNNVGFPRDAIRFSPEVIESGETDAFVLMKRYMEWAGSVVRFNLESDGRKKHSKGKIVMTGGAAASAVWPQIIANICDVTVEAIVWNALTAYGAACYAADAIGVTFSDGFGDLTQPRVYEPTNTDRYEQWYEQHQKPALQKCL